MSHLTVASTYLAPEEIGELRERARAADRTIAAEIRRALRNNYFTKMSAPAAGNGEGARTAAGGPRREPV